MDDKKRNEARFLWLTDVAWLVLTVVLAAVIITWIFYEWSRGTPPFEQSAALLGLVIELVLGFSSVYIAKRAARESKRQRAENRALHKTTHVGIDDVKQLVSLEADASRAMSVDLHHETQEKASDEHEETRQQNKQNFNALGNAIATVDENVDKSTEINLKRHDQTQATLYDVQSGVGQVSEDIRNLPQRMKEQELIEKLIAAADNFEHRFRHTYAEDQLGALQGARIDFDKLRPLAKHLLQDDLSEIYDVFHNCCMELAFAVQGLAKSSIPPASEEKWNSVCCGPRRKELDAAVKGAYDNLQKKLHRDNA